MAKSTKPVSTRALAAARVRELVGEIKILTAAFPDLHDAFDEDELPIEFLIRRDGTLARLEAKPRRASRPRASASRPAQRGRAKR